MYENLEIPKILLECGDKDQFSETAAAASTSSGTISSMCIYSPALEVIFSDHAYKPHIKIIRHDRTLTNECTP
jgi:hypothetical protein